MRELRLRYLVAVYVYYDIVKTEKVLQLADSRLVCVRGEIIRAAAVVWIQLRELLLHFLWRRIYEALKNTVRPYSVEMDAPLVLPVGLVMDPQEPCELVFFCFDLLGC